MKSVRRAVQFWRTLALCLGAAWLASCANDPSPRSAAGPSATHRTLIRNVTVIPMDRPGQVSGQDVLISGGRIQRLGRSGTVLGGAPDRVIDGSGKYLIPGLWDMHVHAALEDAETSLGSTFPTYLAHGIVGVRDLGSTLERLQAVRAGLKGRDDLPELVASGPLLDGPRQPWMQSMALPLENAEEARAAAERLAGAGVDFLKVYNNLSPDQFAAVAQVARRRGLGFAGHIPFRLSAEQVSAAGQRSIEHAGLQLVKDCIPEGQKAIPAALRAWIERGFPGRFEETSRWWGRRDASACQALYRRMAARGTWVTPTLANEVKGGPWTSDADRAFLPERLRSACAKTLESIGSAPAAREAADRLIFEQVRELHQAGVGLLAGSDTPNDCLWHGRSLHKELELMVAAGLSPFEALKTATINPALFLGRRDEGTVRAGAVANLVLLEADPLADISNSARIAGVMLKGRWFAAADLKTRAGGSAPSEEQTIVYENASVWTGSGFARRSVATRGGVFLDPAGAGAGARRIDLAGGFVVPPYANAHAHVTPANAAGSWSYVKNGVFYVWNPTTVVMDEAALAFFRRPDSYDVAVSQGGITEPGGHPEKLYVDVLTRFVYPGKTLQYFLNNAFHYGRTPAEIDTALDRLKAQRADFVKAYLLYSEEYPQRRDDPAAYGMKGLNPANLPYLVSAARQRGLRVAVHVETVQDLKAAAASGAAVAAHLPGYWALRTEEDLRRRTLTAADAALIARSGMLLVATYAIAPGGFAEAEKKGTLDRAMQAKVYAVQAQNIRLLRAAGAALILGTDTNGPIFDEVEHLVKIGALGDADGLAVALGTGRHLFPQRRLGCFEPGCEADFLVLEADPSRDIRALRGIRMRVKAGGEMLEPPAPSAAPQPGS